MTRRGGPAHSPFMAEALRRREVCRTEWMAYIEGVAAAAEHVTNGYTVNARGRAKGVTTWDLFVGPGARLRLAAYATEELRDYLEDRAGDGERVLSFQEWEAAHLWVFLPAGQH